MKSSVFVYFTSLSSSLTNILCYQRNFLLGAKTYKWGFRSNKFNYNFIQIYLAWFSNSWCIIMLTVMKSYIFKYRCAIKLHKFFSQYSVHLVNITSMCPEGIMHSCTKKVCQRDKIIYTEKILWTTIDTDAASHTFLDLANHSLQNPHIKILISLATGKGRAPKSYYWQKSNSPYSIRLLTSFFLSFSLIFFFLHCKLSYIITTCLEPQSA